MSPVDNTFQEDTTDNTAKPVFIKKVIYSHQMTPPNLPEPRQISKGFKDRILDFYKGVETWILLSNNAHPSKMDEQEYEAYNQKYKEAFSDGFKKFINIFDVKTEVNLVERLKNNARESYSEYTSRLKDNFNYAINANESSAQLQESDPNDIEGCTQTIMTMIDHIITTNPGKSLSIDTNNPMFKHIADEYIKLLKPKPEVKFTFTGPEDKVTKEVDEKIQKVIKDENDLSKRYTPNVIGV